MKRLNQNVRVFDDKSLEYLGTYEKNRVGIIGKHEIVLDFPSHFITWIYIGLIMVGMILCMSFESKKLQKTYEDYKEVVLENQTLKEYVAIAELDNRIEILAGRYATSRTPIPSDRDEVYKMCVQSGAWYPEIIMAQLILESGTGTSSIAKNARNLYGMKKVGENGRPTLQIPGVDWNGYGMYLNWQHSILDRVLWDFWLFKKIKPATREEYLNRIDGIYAEDPDYIKKVLALAGEWEQKTDMIQQSLEQDSGKLIK